MIILPRCKIEDLEVEPNYGSRIIKAQLLLTNARTFYAADISGETVVTETKRKPQFRPGNLTIPFSAVNEGVLNCVS